MDRAIRRLKKRLDREGLSATLEQRDISKSPPIKSARPVKWLPLRKCCVRATKKNVIDPSPWETLFLAGLSEWSYPDSLIMSQLTKEVP